RFVVGLILIGAAALFSATAFPRLARRRNGTGEDVPARDNGSKGHEQGIGPIVAATPDRAREPAPEGPETTGGRPPTTP
ncbi:MAG TPA: hypothetical protein VF968_06530, partial [Actinomycetota bacterium]